MLVHYVFVNLFKNVKPFIKFHLFKNGRQHVDGLMKLDLHFPRPRKVSKPSGEVSCSVGCDGLTTSLRKKNHLYRRWNAEFLRRRITLSVWRFFVLVVSV